MAWRGLGRSRLAAADTADAIARLERALALFVELNREQDAARTRLDLGQALAAAGDSERAQGVLSEARDSLARMGAKHDRSRAERLLEELPSPS